MHSIADKPGSASLTDNIPLVLGLRFTTTAVGDVTAFRYYKAVNDVAMQKIGRIYNAGTGALLASTATFDDSACSGGQWVSVPLTAKLRTTTSITYLAAIDPTQASRRSGAGWATDPYAAHAGRAMCDCPGSAPSVSLMLISPSRLPACLPPGLMQTYVKSNAVFASSGSPAKVSGDLSALNSRYGLTAGKAPDGSDQATSDYFIDGE